MFWGLVNLRFAIPDFVSLGLATVLVLGAVVEVCGRLWCFCWFGGDLRVVRVFTLYLVIICSFDVCERFECFVSVCGLVLWLVVWFGYVFIVFGRFAFMFCFFVVMFVICGFVIWTWCVFIVGISDLCLFDFVL